MPLLPLLALLWELVSPLLFLGGLLVFALCGFKLYDLWLQYETRSQGESW
jgi:hypothetical protein